MTDPRPATRARVALGAVRISTGGLGLLLPRLLIQRMDPSDPPSPAAVYFARLFGIRTLLIGRDLLVRSGEDLDRSLDEAVLVHGSDTVTATLLTLGGTVPRRSGILLVGISAANTVLALVARSAHRD